MSAHPASDAPLEVILVHGAWHGPWAWDSVVPELRRRGANATAVQLPSCTPELAGLVDDARAVGAAVAALPREATVVVCGHSYGGMAITEAVYDRPVHLIYLAAFMPEEGMSLVEHFPTIPAYAQVRRDDTIAFDKTVARETLYNDCDPVEAAQWTERLVLHALAAPTTPATRASWREHPSTYVVCTDDNTVPVETQRMFAARATRVHQLATSHSPMLSQPAAVAALLTGAPYSG